MRDIGREIFFLKLPKVLLERSWILQGNSTVIMPRHLAKVCFSTFSLVCVPSGYQNISNFRMKCNQWSCLYESYSSFSALKKSCLNDQANSKTEASISCVKIQLSFSEPSELGREIKEDMCPLTHTHAHTPPPHPPPTHTHIHKVSATLMCLVFFLIKVDDELFDFSTDNPINFKPCGVL